MTADREVLREAVLKAIEGEMTATYQDVPILDPELIADAIVDAVLAADGQEGSVEWSPRYTDGSQMFAATFTEAGARRYVDESNGGLALYKRHCGPWRRVPDADR